VPALVRGPFRRAVPLSLDHLPQKRVAFECAERGAWRNPLDRSHATFDCAMRLLSLIIFSVAAERLVKPHPSIPQGARTRSAASARKRVGFN